MNLLYVVASEDEDEPGFAVHAVLTNGDWAELLADAVPGDSQIFTFSLDNIPEEIKEGKQFWSAQFSDWSKDSELYLNMLTPMDREEETNSSVHPKYPWVEFDFWANGEKEATRIAKEKRAEFYSHKFIPDSAPDPCGPTGNPLGAQPGAQFGRGS